MTVESVLRGGRNDIEGLLVGRDYHEHDLSWASYCR
jgi:hypothetical protein